MPKTAFIVLKSPQELDPTHAMRRFADKNDASAILLEDGVYQALVDGPSRKLAEVAQDVLISKEDLLARGFGPADLKVGIAVDYPDMIDCIMERTERTITI